VEAQTTIANAAIKLRNFFIENTPNRGVVGAVIHHEYAAL
jgi:hypothetical protein